MNKEIEENIQERERNALYLKDSDETMMSPDRICPVCGYNNKLDWVGIHLGIEDLDGNYCVACWVRSWIKNVPKLQGVKSES